VRKSANFQGDGILLEWWLKQLAPETKEGYVRKVRWKTTTFPWELETWKHVAPYNWSQHPLVLKLERQKTQEKANEALAAQERKSKTLAWKLDAKKREVSMSKISVITWLDVVAARIFEKLQK